MTTTHKIVGSVVGVALLAGVANVQVQDLQSESTTQKPNTNAEWANDVKEDRLHIRSRQDIASIIESHQIHLKEITPAYSDYTECPVCVKRDLKKEFADLIDASELDAFVEQEFQVRLNQITDDYIRTEQVIERAQKELDMRESGYLIEIKKGEEMPNNIPEDNIRVIYD